MEAQLRDWTWRMKLSLLSKNNLVMKKTTYLVMLILLFQEALGQERKFEPVRFGIRTGVNFSHLNFLQEGETTLISSESSWHSGFHFGFLISVPLRKGFYVQPEYLYSQMSAEVELYGSVYTANYFSLPVLLKWQFLRRVAILLGPQFGLLINAYVLEGGEKIKLMDEMENRHFGVLGEAEVNVFGSFFVGGRFLQGLNNVDLLRAGERYDFNYQLWQITLNYKF